MGSEHLALGVQLFLLFFGVVVAGTAVTILHDEGPRWWSLAMTRLRRRRARRAR